eukprot:m.167433 g.167433  ORF g.167433 m.167433 type:complete len:163 (+) comp38932_c0_seq1:84-572(+)
MQYLERLLVSALCWSHCVFILCVRSYKDGSLKKKTLSEQLAPGFALLMWMVLPCAWAYMSHVDILNTETRWVYWLQGILYSNIVCRLIVSQMSSTECDRWNWLLSPFLFILPGVHFQMINEVLILKAYTVGATLLHLYYGACIVRELCDHLKIMCFSIPVRT